MYSKVTHHTLNAWLMAILPCDLSLCVRLTPFSDIHISQGATCLRRGGIFKHFVANLLPSSSVKKMKIG